MLKYFFEIIKPRIVIGNLISLIGSFLFASRNFFDIFLFLWTVLGVFLIISSSCIFNNIIDIDIDKKMNRTKSRLLIRKTFNPILISILGLLMGCLGVLILGCLVNFLSMFLSILGFIIYVFLYTLLSKKYTMYSTFIGSFSGSIPSVIGYTAVNNTFDVFCFLLFIIFIFWQMSHFYAIAIYHIHDYKKANIPLFPIVKGILVAKKHIFFYIIGFIFFIIIATFLGYFSYLFLFLSSIINFYWLYISYLSIKEKNDRKFSRELFLLSIIVIMLFNILMSINFIF
ncbi:protoheme IX farnesyltransferase [Buchnera aphidicola (Melanaphis sacchari)]|uniref:Protoheme IX farnesyltransferase n=1 Tax=Buchnera aphidicola (Melanaphis sacchari) TaxID=2173854 RepID=A0A2U8DG09_9GAMM|nr:heme o synthase [Buchnera aphidicola]AWH90760.1 protoheme IX farnesyltransferase [Buchnera aphidicola (Melanaphis sacchari)]